MEWTTSKELREIVEREKMARYYLPLFEQRRKSWTSAKAKKNIEELIARDLSQLIKKGSPCFVVKSAYKIVTQNKWDDCLEIPTEDIGPHCEVVLRYLDTISADLHVSLFYDEKQQQYVRLRLKPNY